MAKHINVALTDTSADGREAFRVHIGIQLGLKVYTVCKLCKIQSSSLRSNVGV